MAVGHRAGYQWPAPAISSRHRRFQDRHGSARRHHRQGTVALNVPLSRRVEQLALSLERLRWIPDLEGERFIVVNIPTFHLWAWDSLNAEGAPSIDMNVIVGRNTLNTQTPVFVEQMRFVIFRPYWNVPPGILRSETLPAIRKDPAGYLARNDMEIVQGQGDDAKPVAPSPENIELLGRGQLRVRQRPGPRNSLGLVKFMFPNDENVYLHSTPAQELFSRNKRDQPRMRARTSRGSRRLGARRRELGP
jgi:murein L,D-transpeptidase YcbB/YkuD